MANGSQGSDLKTIVAPEVTTVRNAAAFRDTLLEALEGHSRVELDLSLVQELDIAFFQLICAAHRTAESQGKVFTVNLDEASEAVLTAVQQCGLGRHIGCFLDAQGHCPWAQEG